MINELMREEILDAPQAIESSLPVLRERAHGLRGLQARRISLAGSGDSWCAAGALRAAISRRTQAEVHATTALEAARYWEYQADDLLVAISISGESARAVEAAQAAKGAGARVVAVTGRAQSTLASMAEASLVIPFQARSRQTPHTTDYLTTLLALAVLAEALAGERIPLLDGLAGLVGKTIEQMESPCRELAQSMTGVEEFFFVGAGPNLATTYYGAAKFWEAGGLHAHAFEVEEFSHGPHLMVEAGDAVIVLAPAGRSHERGERLAEALTGLGAIVAVVSDVAEGSGVRLAAPAVEEEWSPLVTCLPLQWLCYGVSTAKGHDVVRKDGIHANPGDYEALHWSMVRA